MDTDMKVQKLANGYVIDHVPAGNGLVLAKVLDLTAANGETLLVGTNLASGKHGRKDIIKMEDRILTQEEESKVALVAPNATVSIIRNYKVAEKRTLSVPGAVEDLIRCPNPRCITRLEPRQSFTVEGTDPVLVRCRYCERTLQGNEVGENIVTG